MKEYKQILLLRIINNIFKRFSFICVVFVCFVSCTEPTRSFYSTGELETERVVLNDSMTRYTGFYKNGKIKEMGALLRDSFPDGIWKEYYSDGVLKWKGKYDCGHWVIGSDDDIDNWKNKAISIDFEKNLGEYQQYDTLRFRIRIDGIRSEWYSVCVAQKNEFPNVEVLENMKDEFCYPYQVEILPKYIQKSSNNESYIEIVVFFMNKDGALISGGSNCKSTIVYLANL